MVNTTTEVEHSDEELEPRRRRLPGRSAETAEEPGPDSLSVDEALVSRRKSTNIIKEPRRAAQPLGGVQRAVRQDNELGYVSDAVRAAVHKSRVDEPLHESDDTVRRRSTQKSSTTETDQTAAPTDPRQSRTARRSPLDDRGRRLATGRRDREASPSHEEERHLRQHSKQFSVSERQPNADVISRRARHRRPIPRSAPEDEEKDANKSVRRSRRRSTMSDPTDDNIETFVQNFGEPVASREKLDDIAAQSLSHDGSSSHHSFSRRTSAPSLVPTSNTGVEEGYYSIEVPDHVDYRGCYGRRKTKDFGYPGARIKPRSTFRTYKAPLEDPGNWIKRACGHFSNISATESREEASKRPCRQCRGKHALPDPALPTHHHSHKRATTDSSTSSSHSHNREDERSHRHRQHHSDCMPSDKCGDTLAHDLGYVIDSILEEHANTLQSVINNIKFSQPNLAQLRRVSQDLVRRTKSAGFCEPSCHTVCRSFPCSHIYQPCQPVYQSCQPCQPCQPIQQVCEWQPACPYVPPKSAEKLNVGSPGQLGPTLNDDRASLQDNIRSVPDVVDLVKSAADDFGVDLDDRPTASDDETFEQAPVEAPRRQPAPMVSRRSTTLEPVAEKFEDNNLDSEDTWLQKTRRQLTELSEARSQLMDELDSIAEDLGVHLVDPRRSSVETDPVQGVLSKVSTGISRRSTRLRNKSLDSVVGEIPRMIDEVDEKRLSRVLTRIQSQSRRMSTMSQGLQEFDTIPPEEIQEWLEVAQYELPAAIDSLTNVLETLPALDFEPEPELEFETAHTQPEYESNTRYEEYPQPQEYDEQDHDDYRELETPRRRSRAYTEPILQLQDRIADLERRLGHEIKPNQDSLEEEPGDFEAPVLRMADQQPPEEEEKYQATWTSTLLQSRKSTQTVAALADTSSSASSEQWPEPQSEGKVEPQNVERMATHRRISVGSRKPSVLLKKTDFVNPEPEVAFEEHEDPPFNLQQKIAESNLEFEPGVGSRRSTQRQTPLRPTPEPELEPEVVSRVSTRNRTTVPSRQPTLWNVERQMTLGIPGECVKDEPGSQVEVDDFPHPALLRSPGLETEVPVENEDFHPSVARKATGLELKGIRRPSIRSPSITSAYSEPIENKVNEPAPVSRQITRQLTRRQNIPITPESKLEEHIVTRMRRTATQKSAKSPSPTREEVVEVPTISRIATRQPTRKPTIQPEPQPDDASFDRPVMRMRRSSTQSPEPDHEPVLSRPLTRQPTRHDTVEVLDQPSETPLVSRSRTGTLIPLSKAVTEALAAFPPPASVTLSPLDDDPPPEGPPHISRDPTRKLTERLSTLGLSRVTTTKPTEIGPSPEPVVQRVTTSKPTERIPSPEPVVERVLTRRPTKRSPEPTSINRKATTMRRATERDPSPEYSVESLMTRHPTERLPSPEPLIRRVTTRRPIERMPSPEPVIERVVSRQATERMLSPEPNMPKATTRRRTEPLVAHPTPPSSPSLSSQTPHHLSREVDIKPVEPTKDPELPVSHMPYVPTRAITRWRTMPRQTTLRRPSIQPEEIALPESVPTSPSPVIDVAPPRDPSPPLPHEEDEFQFPVMRMRQCSTIYEADQGPVPVSEVESEAEPEPAIERNATEIRRRSAIRMDPPSISRLSTLEKRRALLEKMLTFPSRQTTMLIESPAVSRIATRQPTQLERTPTIGREPIGETARQPTRRPSERNEDTVPISRQPTHRRSDSDEAAMLERRTSRQPTRQPSQAMLDSEHLFGVIQRDVQREPTLRGEELRSATEPELVQREIERKPTVREDEPALERQHTQQSTTVNRAATRRPTRQAKLALEEDSPQLLPTHPFDVEEEPINLVRRDKQATGISRQPTSMERQTTILTEQDEPLIRRSTRRVTDRVPSPSPDMGDSDLEAEPEIRRATRQSTEMAPSARHEEVEPVVRRATTRRAPQRAPSLPPEYPEMQVEPIFGRTTTRQPTGRISGPLEEIEQEPVVRRVTTRHPTRHEREPSVVQNESPPAQTRHHTHQSTLQPTSAHAEPQDEATFASSTSSSTTESGALLERFIRRQATIEVDDEPKLPRRKTTVRTETRQFEQPVMRVAVPSRQAPQHESLDTLEGLSTTETESEHTNSLRLRRPSTMEERLSTASIDAVKDESIDGSETDFIERKASLLSRKSTQISRVPTLQPTVPSRRPTEHMNISSAGYESDSESQSELKPKEQVTKQQTGVSRHPTVPKSLSPVAPSRQPTRRQSGVNRQLTAREEFSPSAMAISRMAEPDDFTPSSRKASTQVFGNPTRVPTAPLSRIATEVIDRQSTPLRVDTLTSRRSTEYERLATRTSTKPVFIPDDGDSTEQLPMLRRPTTRNFRQPTRAATDLRNAEPEPESKSISPSSSSAQSSVLDEPLAEPDIYGANPVPDDEMPRKSSHMPTQKEILRPQRASTLKDAPEEKLIRIQEDPASAYNPPFTPRLASRQPTSTLERQPTTPSVANELDPEETLVQQPVSRMAGRQPTLPAEEIPEEEPSRLDRSSTSDLGREPGSLAPPLHRDGFLGESANEPERRRSSVLPRVLTVPAGRQRKLSLAAPGIVAPAAQEVPRNLEPITPAMKARDAVNFSPDQQYPPAPAYPTRDTPSWVKPDTHTPPPKPKMQAPPRRRILGFRAKPREESQIVSRAIHESEPQPEPEPESEPHHDEPVTQPPEPA